MLGMLTLLPTDSYTSTMYSVRLILCVQFTSSTSTTNTDFLNNINNVVYLQLNLKRKKKLTVRFLEESFLNVTDFFIGRLVRNFKALARDRYLKDAEGRKKALSLRTESGLSVFRQSQIDQRHYVYVTCSIASCNTVFFIKSGRDKIFF